MLTCDDLRADVQQLEGLVARQVDDAYRLAPAVVDPIDPAAPHGRQAPLLDLVRALQELWRGVHVDDPSQTAEVEDVELTGHPVALVDVGEDLLDVRTAHALERDRVRVEQRHHQLQHPVGGRPGPRLSTSAVEPGG